MSATTTTRPAGRPGLTIVELATLIMRQERVGWSKAMHIAAERVARRQGAAK